MNLGSKFTGGIGAIVCISLVVVGLGYYVSHVSSKTIDHVSDYSAPLLKASSRTRSDLLRMLGSVQSYLVTGEEQYLSRYRAEENIVSGGLEGLEMLSQSHHGSELADPFLEFKQTFSEWRMITKDIIRIHKSPRLNQPAIRLAHIEVEPLYRDGLRGLQNLLEVQQNLNGESFVGSVHEKMIKLKFLFTEMIYSLRGYAAVGGKSFKYIYATSLIRINSLIKEIDRDLSESDGQSRIAFNGFVKTRDDIVAIGEQIEQWVDGDRSHESLYIFQTEAMPRAEFLLKFIDDLVDEDENHLAAELNHARGVLSSFEWQILTIGFFAIGLSTCLVLLFRLIMIRPIERLTKGAMQISEGDLSVHVAVESHDEIGILARSFNAMTTRLRGNIESLIRHRNELDDLVSERTKDLRLFRQLIENSNDLVLVINPVSGQFLDVNRAASVRLGYEKNQLLKMSIVDIHNNFFFDRISWDEYVDAVRVSGSSVEECVFQDKEGQSSRSRLV